ALESAVVRCLGRAHRDESVAEAAGFLGGDRPGGRYIDWRRVFRHSPQPHRLHLVVLAGMLDVLAGEELADDFDRLEHPADPLRDLRQVPGEDVIVERLTSTHTTTEASRVLDGHLGQRLSEDGR